MREILFRGEQSSDNEWCEGYYYSDGTKFYIAYEGKKDCIIHEVIPETVGQFTGLTDKRGKKIFEGDIVRYELSAYGKSLTKDYEIVSHNYSWGCKNEKGNISRLDLFEPSLLEVIGNKHER